MNTNALFPLTAAALLVACVSAAAVSGDRAASDSATPVPDIVDLPTVTVRPAAEDLAYYRANRIVDLPTVTVRPEPRDLAYFLASSRARIVELPVVTVRPSAEDVQEVAVDAVTLVHRMASR